MFSLRMKYTWGLAVLVLIHVRPLSADDAIYQKTLPSTCWVVGPMSGTGWVVDAEKNLVVTCHHVVGEAGNVTLYFPIFREGNLMTSSGFYRNQKAGIKGRVLAVDRTRDLALVQLDRLPHGVSALALADALPKNGDKVYSVGNSTLVTTPTGHLWHFREGKVLQVLFTVFDLSNTAGKVEARLVISDSGVRPGDSGGPLVNETGQLVGIVFALGPKHSFSVAASEIRLFLDRVQDGKAAAAASVEGVWTAQLKAGDKRGNARFTFAKDGTFSMETDKFLSGAYTYQRGVLTLEISTGGMRETLTLQWLGNDQFRFTSTGVEFVCQRR